MSDGADAAVYSWSLRLAASLLPSLRPRRLMSDEADAAVYFGRFASRLCSFILVATPRGFAYVRIAQASLIRGGPGLSYGLGKADRPSGPRMITFAVWSSSFVAGEA